MAEFVLLTVPDIRAIVQDRTLERAFHDSLYPRLMFRADMLAEEWGGNIGDSRSFTRPSLLTPIAAPLTAGAEPTPQTQTWEQWEAFIQQFAGTIDTHMPTSAVAAASIFARNAHQLGLQAGQSLNRLARNRLYQAYLSGHTTFDGSPGALTTFHVRNINGFTKKLKDGRPQPVSATNTLEVFLGAGGASRIVTSFAADVSGDEIGPGTLTITAAFTFGADDAVLAVNRPTIVRAGAALLSSLGLVAADVLTLRHIQTAIAQLRQANIPPHPDGFYHIHLDPISEVQLFRDTEFQNLNTALPDFVIYRDLAIGQLLGGLWFRNTECPSPSTVASNESIGNSTLLSTSGATIRRVIVTGYGSIYEMYMDEARRFITEAGVTGKVGNFSVTNNAIAVVTDRIRYTIRAPLDRLQQMISQTWSWSGDFPVPTDALTGGSSVYKRGVVVEHGS